MIITEENLKYFASPISDSEDEMCKHAISMVRDALKNIGYSDNGNIIGKLESESSAYQIRMGFPGTSRDINIFVQGSYANGTNVRRESDVDIAIVQEDIFQPRYREGVTGANYGFTPAVKQAKKLKDEVEEALKDKFGPNEVQRHNKSVHVSGNSYRKESDSVPCLRFRDYSNDYDCNPNNYVKGIYIHSDDGKVIINYPEQHIRNGVVKNQKTSYRFKKIVRIFKHLKIQMSNLHYLSAQKMSSFLIESILWNVRVENYLRYQNISSQVREVIEYLSSHLDNIYTWNEINNVKLIRQDGINRVSICQDFINDLNKAFTFR